MSKLASLKKKAADLERKSPEKALPVYIEMIAEMEKYPEDMDVALYNRVGDLMVKQGNVSSAVDYYERAVDYYVDGGFLNNAIALCNKILRSSPGRATVYYKLGKISAHKGFKADAKQNFLEYADRMQKVGKMDEAFRALAEFADLCPDQTDIRLMLSDQLTKAGKKAEAIEQLQILHEQLDAEGNANEAAAAVARMRALDPSVEPRTGGKARSTGGSDDLVFLDLGDSPKAQVARRSIAAQRATKGIPSIQEAPRKSTPPPPPPKAAPAPRAAAPVAPPAAPPRPSARAAAPPPPPVVEEPVVEELEEIAPAEEAVSEQAAPEPEFIQPEPELVQPVPEIIQPEPTFDVSEVEPQVIDTFEVTANPTFDPPVSSSLDPNGAGLLGFEPTSFGDTGSTSLDAPPDADTPSLLDLDASPLSDPVEPARAADSGMLDFIMPDSGPTSAQMPDVHVPSEDSIGALEMLEPQPEEPLAPDDLEDLARLSVAGGAVSPISAKSLDVLRAVVDGDPEDWGARRELAEGLLEAGDREDGLRELEIAMMGYEKTGDLTSAMSIADEIVRIDPSSVKHHQKRVEYAYRTSDRAQLVESYLSLADALFRTGQVDKSRTIYQRVLELSPDDVRAQAALTTMPEGEPEPAPPPAARKTVATPKKPATPARPAPLASAKPTPVGDDAFVNLGDLLREDETPKDTRMVVAEEEPSGNEEADFQDMLRKFKQGVAENVEAEDYQSHYDLGVAYKEMGLVDEAISEFQKALRGPDNRVRTYEAIGQCFIEKGQFQIAATILARALSEKHMDDDQLVGVLYLLGRAYEALGKPDEALPYYQRVFVVDIQFHDVADRLNALENAAR